MKAIKDRLIRLILIFNCLWNDEESYVNAAYRQSSYIYHFAAFLIDALNICSFIGILTIDIYFEFIIHKFRYSAQ